jgi:DNA mismatch endonuclease Vsr
MADHLSAKERSNLMRKVRGKDTKPELIVRRLIHSMGHRYRLHVGNLPGRPDIVFTRKNGLSSFTVASGIATAQLAASLRVCRSPARISGFRSLRPTGCEMPVTNVCFKDWDGKYWLSGNAN